MQTYRDGISIGSRPPHINRRHIDGPLLVFSDGQLHWLTLAERVLFFMGLTDAEEIQRQRRPNLIAPVTHPSQEQTP